VPPGVNTRCVPIQVIAHACEILLIALAILPSMACAALRNLSFHCAGCPGGWLCPSPSCHCPTCITHMHACTHTHTHTHAHTPAHSTQAAGCALLLPATARPASHTCTHAHTHTHKHTRTRTHARTRADLGGGAVCAPLQHPTHCAVPGGGPPVLQLRCSCTAAGAPGRGPAALCGGGGASMPNPLPPH